VYARRLRTVAQTVDVHGPVVHPRSGTNRADFCAIVDGVRFALAASSAVCVSPEECNEGGIPLRTIGANLATTLPWRDRSRENRFYRYSPHLAAAACRPAEASMARSGEIRVALLRARANSVILREAEQNPLRVAEALERVGAELIGQGALSPEEFAEVVEALLIELSEGRVPPPDGRVQLTPRSQPLMKQSRSGATRSRPRRREARALRREL
jgi:hypothetical protein